MAHYRLTVGQVVVHIVDDGVMWVDAGGVFGLVPKRLWQRVATADDENRVPTPLRCLLIESQGRRILVDTGYGDKISPRVREILNLGERRDRLLSSLAQAGFTPEMVDIVVNTHLHGDHCGGNTRVDAEGHVVPTFPAATYWIQRRELADATYPNERTRGTYFSENFRPLLDRDQVHLVDGDVWITDEVRTWVTPGHTPTHQCIVIESDGEAAIFTADAIAWAVHLERLAWVPAFDIEPMISIQTKKQILAWASHRRALLIFQHDPKVMVGRVAQSEDAITVETVVAGREEETPGER